MFCGASTRCGSFEHWPLISRSLELPDEGLWECPYFRNVLWFGNDYIARNPSSYPRYLAFPSECFDSLLNCASVFAP